MSLTDSLGRKHNYLRISLTDRCNLRCLYCMPHNDMQFMPPARLMSADEIQRFAEIFVELGVRKIRLTGGEPLMRRDAGTIVENLSSLKVKLAITTNGYFLHRYFDTFEKVGLNSINLSLDTLRKDRFEVMSQRKGFDRTWQNIEEAIRRGFYVKLNMVVMKNRNEDEINDFVELTRHMPIHVRFIEFMPFAENRWDISQTVSYASILKRIEQSHSYARIADAANDTARNFRVQGSPGTFAVISSVTNPFCDTCNRIRLTADGKIKNCLFAQHETDLLTVLRNGGDVERLIKENIAAKHAARGGLPEFSAEQAPELFSKNRSMISIGG
ncbi:MAG: GTP 3',8-cyclase MoaA [Cryomorphaceae bacterium]|nr:MAG: GTP 3',8-cyclase MoaA [Cryomorphaceae bacterium]